MNIPEQAVDTLVGAIVNDTVMIDIFDIDAENLKQRVLKVFDSVNFADGIHFEKRSHYPHKIHFLLKSGMKQSIMGPAALEMLKEVGITYSQVMVATWSDADKFLDQVFLGESDKG